MINRSTYFLALLFIAITILPSCNKDDQDVGSSGVPYVPVNVLINTNLPAYFDISIPGGWVYYAAGSKGLIIYRKSQDVFIAMDRHCPYQAQNGCQVHMDQSAAFSEDTDCCNSQYGVNDGSILQGPTSQSLKMYQTTFDGTLLRVFN